MKFKIVRLLFLSALFFAILFATLMFRTSNHASMAANSLTQKPATDGHPSTILIGDPVGGGSPCGDPVGGGSPL